MVHLLAMIILEISVKHLPSSKLPSIKFLEMPSKSTSSGDQMVVAHLVVVILLEIHIKHLALSKQLASVVLRHLVKIHSMW